MLETFTYKDAWITTLVFGGLFLLAMWGSFFFFVRFKKRDDAHRYRDYNENGPKFK